MSIQDKIDEAKADFELAAAAYKAALEVSVEAWCRAQVHIRESMTTSPAYREYGAKLATAEITKEAMRRALDRYESLSRAEESIEVGRMLRDGLRIGDDNGTA